MTGAFQTGAIRDGGSREAAVPVRVVAKAETTRFQNGLGHRRPAERAVSTWLARSIMEHMSPHVSIDRDAVSAFCQRHHIARLALFGSVLRDDFGPDSDVDVLVEFQAGHVPGFNFVSIEREFSGLLKGRRVDMVTPKFLNPAFAIRS